ncbi:hypothetical protein [Roseitalea porphyridii]|uniref:Uncharacterized protein n=1 Tax=Roseitalea porphyridii TaxID=1852022 RepID=A0A4P6V089_9HYPH|nr:hypothetical protein [Roseitalea porphyridii]QBK30495.1 hypothetical protein E0E05_07715 [Roseitalea porphyridii]
MRDVFEALLPDFADDPRQHASGAMPRGEGDAFEPLLGPRPVTEAFQQRTLDRDFPHGMAPAGGAADAVALQSMLTDAFGAPETAGEPQSEMATEPPTEPVEPEPLAQEAVAYAEPEPVEPEGPDKDAIIAELQAEIAALRQAHADELARLGAEAVPAMAETVAAAVTAALGPILAHPLLAAVETAAIDRFREEVAAMIRAGGGVAVRLSGPQDLLDTVRDGWPEGLALPDLAVADGPELVAIADQAVLSTRLAELRPLLLGEGS